ncbi:MAG TPA: RHS repeat-associated core domain-containing protein [Candidatus Angelobacter sp.]|nr:RHS repeat-associated core domain-containing protein [Candidatus Angelobacter sp.]
MGRVLSNRQCTPATCGTSSYLLSYGWDLAGDLTSASNGVGVTFTYGYNSAARLTSVSSSLVDAQHPATLLSTAHYGPFGILSDTLGNGVAETLGYNGRGLLNSYSSTPYSFTLTGIAGNGSITASTDSVNGAWTYGYDQFNRLLSSNKNSGAQTFTYDYDRYGNRWHQNAPQGGPAPQYLFDTTTNRINGSGVAYDALGNMTNDGFHAYSYDAESRLAKVDGGSTATYVYDADSRRIKNTSTEFLYDLAGHAVTLINPANGNWNNAEIYAGGRHLATYTAGTPGSTNFMHADWLGSKRVMTSISGVNSETCTGLPFGDGASCTQTDWNFDRFTDDVHDSETNLEHTWFRQFSTTQGRWTIPDPYLGSADTRDPQSINRSSYVANRPTISFDPQGLSPRRVNCPMVESQQCMAQPGLAGVQLGNDFFDALFGAPGTFVSLDRKSNLGFGFSQQLWVQTNNFLDEQFANFHAEQAYFRTQGTEIEFTPNPILTVFADESNDGITLSGIVPDKLALDAEKSWLVTQLSLADQKYIVGLERTHDPYAGSAFASVVQSYPALAPYGLAMADAYNAWSDQLRAVFEVRKVR